MSTVLIEEMPAGYGEPTDLHIPENLGAYASAEDSNEEFDEEDFDDDFDDDFEEELEDEYDTEADFGEGSGNVDSDGIPIPPKSNEDQ